MSSPLARIVLPRGQVRRQGSASQPKGRRKSMKHFVSAGLGVTAGFVSALALFPAAQAADVGSRGLDLFREAFQRVRADYVRPVKDNELISAAISGMVSSLDPHSSYMDPKEMAD